MRNWQFKGDFDAVLSIYKELRETCVPEHSRTQESSLKSCCLWLFLGPCCQCCSVPMAFQCTILLFFFFDHFCWSVPCSLDVQRDILGIHPTPWTHQFCSLEMCKCSLALHCLSPLEAIACVSWVSVNPEKWFCPALLPEPQRCPRILLWDI